MNAEDERALRRRKEGLPRELQQSRTVCPHPSNGGSRGYSVPFRIAEIYRFELGEETTASERSIRRWIGRLIPRRPTGGTEREGLVGVDLFLLVFYLTAWPDADANELIMHFLVR